MGKKVVLLPLTRKNGEGTKHHKIDRHLFITISEKKLLKELEQDLLGLIIVNKFKEQPEAVEPKLQQLFNEFQHLKKEPEGLPPLHITQYNHHIHIYLVLLARSVVSIRIVHIVNMTILYSHRIKFTYAL